MIFQAIGYPFPNEFGLNLLRVTQLTIDRAVRDGRVLQRNPQVFTSAVAGHRGAVGYID